VIALLTHKAHRRSIPIRTELAESLPQVMADRVQVQQVLLNLMLNGIEAMKAAVGELIIQSRRTDDGQLMISVSDSGIGIPAEQADQIFDAFFTTKPQGTGMGLVWDWRLARPLAKLMGAASGEIQFGSRCDLLLYATGRGSAATGEAPCSTFIIMIF